MTGTKARLLLLAPSIAVIAAFFLLPLANVAEKSFRQVSRTDVFGILPYTVQNYLETLHPAYVGYFLDMIRIGLISTVCGVVLAYPIAYFIARRRSGRVRTLLVGFFIAFLFLSVLVRVYSFEITFGTVGVGQQLSAWFGFSLTGRAYGEFLVIIGLMHHNIPLSTLILVGAIQNVNPRLAEAAQALGASRWQAHQSTTLPLSSRGILSAFLINYTIAISAFVVPMVLGKGKVLFLSNLIYRRFGESANFPGGSALAVELLLFSFVFVYALQSVVPARWERK
jgi:ABC-type spermidine/putrescine transport system permease subunit I